MGTNSKESQNAESKADFIHKLKIAIKEADETDIGCYYAMHTKAILIVKTY
ncbi:four helix bundle protein [Flavobacterium sp. W22_SRS_FK3]|uniref:four helix bundle protein n=1 Tax=Flavobacterium sp. W22_SRS_FK3 TaxID=3240275 RepID=UPI003F8FF1CF